MRASPQGPPQALIPGSYCPVRGLLPLECRLRHQHHVGFSLLRPFTRHRTRGGSFRRVESSTGRTTDPLQEAARARPAAVQEVARDNDDNHLPPEHGGHDHNDRYTPAEHSWQPGDYRRPPDDLRALDDRRPPDGRNWQPGVRRGSTNDVQPGRPYDNYRSGTDNHDQGHDHDNGPADDHYHRRRDDNDNDDNGHDDNDSGLDNNDRGHDDNDRCHDDDDDRGRWADELGSAGIANS